MAVSKNNVVTHGLSGKIGDMLVFRQLDGKTIVSQVPEKPKRVSEEQLEHQKRFQQATIYAKSAVDSPDTKELYETAAKKKKGVSAYNVAVADFFGAPDIETIDLTEYTGKVGDQIRFVVSDGFAVKAVKVRIINADGSLVEDGSAVQGTGNLWVYAAAQNNESLEGDKIVVSASDLPGNVTQEEQGLKI
jgi:hypothetical protein